MEKEIEGIIRHWIVAPGEGKYTDYEIGIVKATSDLAALFEREMGERDQWIGKLTEYVWHKRSCPVRTLVAHISMPLEDVMSVARRRCNCGYFDVINDKVPDFAKPTEPAG